MSAKRLGRLNYTIALTVREAINELGDCETVEVEDRVRPSRDCVKEVMLTRLGIDKCK
jgi:hypothetical protein